MRQPLARIELKEGLRPERFDPMDVVFFDNAPPHALQALADAPSITAIYETDGIYIRFAPVPEELWEEASAARAEGGASLNQVRRWVGNITTPFFANEGQASSVLRFPRTDAVLVEVGVWGLREAATHSHPADTDKARLWIRTYLPGS